VPVVTLAPWPKPLAVKIVAILPVDKGQGAIRVANLTDRSVNLKGWILSCWALAFQGFAEEIRLNGEVPAGGNLVVSLAGSKLSWNVDGGEISLNNGQSFPNRVSYTAQQVRRGEWGETG
jgi:hypothetical protein